MRAASDRNDAHHSTARRADSTPLSGPGFVRCAGRDHRLFEVFAARQSSEPPVFRGQDRMRVTRDAGSLGCPQSPAGADARLLWQRLEKGRRMSIQARNAATARSWCALRSIAASLRLQSEGTHLQPDQALRRDPQARTPHSSRDSSTSDSPPDARTSSREQG